ncbi:MAG: DUF2079 domain-containing protein [Salinivirgaceae bacterium]|nr:DUF2079 domain-containing protein [Salinivirgaceae bacterium]
MFNIKRIYLMRLKENMFSRNTLLISIFIFFAIIFSLISLTNHYLFRTASQDLGMISHAVYSFAHFTHNYYTLSLGGSEMNYFADHFSPITILYAPFYFIFGSYTLLIIQIASIIFGGFGIYKYSQIYFKNSSISLIILTHFFCIWAIYSALSFDFHNNVVAAMMVPWLIYYHEKKEKKMFLLFFILILISKENMVLWLAFILLGLMINKKNIDLKKYLKFEIPLLAFSILYFIVVVGFIMPYIRDGAGHSQLARYSHLGNSLPEVINTIIRKPLYVISLFFTSPLDKESLAGIKTELHLMVLVSGGYALLFRPRYLIMLLPIYAQKMLTNNYGFWGISNQYSIEFAPILSLCLVSFLTKVKSIRMVYWIAISTAVLTCFFTIHTLENRKSTGQHKTNAVFYDRRHYESNLNLKEIYKQIDKIPDDAILSVSTNLSPHLANRKKIYTFPNVKDADYIILFTSKRTCYPLSRDKFNERLVTLRESDKFELLYDENHLLILRKR